MRLETAVALILWCHGRHHQGAAGRHRDTVAALLALRRGGIDVPDVSIEEGARGPWSADVSLIVERFMARGFIWRLTTPLHLTPWGRRRLTELLRQRAAADGTLAGELRAARQILARHHAPCRAAAAPERRALPLMCRT